MSKNAWMWIILVLIVVVVGAVMLSKKDSVTDNTTVTDGNTNEGVAVGEPNPSGLPLDAQGNVIVRYTNSGFVPKTLMVAKGDSVTFRNDASAAMQISPADPVNEPYASFDQEKASLKTGGTYTYTFTTVGSYTYYNENKKTDTGVITVK